MDIVLNPRTRTRFRSASIVPRASFPFVCIFRPEGTKISVRGLELARVLAESSLKPHNTVNLRDLVSPSRLIMVCDASMQVYLPIMK